jgi:hypothetical protein
MDYPITRSEYDKLPFRDDVQGEYVKGATYRARHYSNLVFVFVGTPKRPEWDVFTVTFEEDE